MKPERWKRIQEVFATALERKPEARAAFLKEECRGDGDLMKEVESLLASHDAASARLLDSPAIDVLSSTPPRGAPPALTQGSRLGSYEIVSPLGAGGMGEVYRARDPRLKRDVAIKVLPRSLSGDPDALSRFEREALAVAALSHPNILSIFDFGNQDGVAYAVMELLEGETLRGKIEAGPIPVRQAVDYALQIAKGLAAAHERGVVHRDLKPENLFVTGDGHLKILDFGLAKKVEGVAPGAETSAPTASGHTEPGTVMGTLGYMSPEQVRGQPVDHRSDIFSFGTILYELLSGSRAFRRETAADTMAAVMKEEPAELSASGRNISPALDHIVKHCIEKRAEHRFQSARDIAFSLAEQSSVPVSPTGLRETRVPAAAEPRARRLRVIVAVVVGLIIVAGAAILLRAPSRAIDSLAVLPLANASADPGVDYLSDGITDALINSLGQLPHLTVMSRDSVSQYRGRQTTAQAAGRELNVQAVLKGQFVQHAEDLSISAELVNVRDNSHLWGGQFHRKLADLQAVQEEIAGQIASRLRGQLAGETKKRMATRYTQNPEAYQLYLKGRYFWEKRTEEPLKKSIEYFNQAIDKDPTYAKAYAGLAAAYARSTAYSSISPRDAIPKSRAAAERALEIDDSLAQAHAVFGYSLWSYDWNYPAAEEEFRKAQSLDPRDVTSHSWYGLLLVSLGRTDEAVAQLQRALEIAPLEGTLQANLARAYLYARQNDRAIEEVRKAPEELPMRHRFLGQALVAKRMPEQARAEYEKAAALQGSNPQGLWDLAMGQAAIGHRSEAHQTIEKLEALAAQRYVSPIYVAQVHAMFGDADRALEWLEKAYVDHTWDLVFLRVNPLWDPLRSDPRFGDLVRRLHLAS